MVNLVEALFAIAAPSALAALVLYVRRRPLMARRLMMCGIVSGGIALLLELYLRM